MEDEVEMFGGEVKCRRGGEVKMVIVCLDVWTGVILSSHPQ